MLSTVRSPLMLTTLLALVAGFVLGFVVRGIVHRCPDPQVPGQAVDLGLKAGPVTDSPEEK